LRNVFQPWDGEPLRLAIYLATLVCPISMPSLRKYVRGKIRILNLQRLRCGSCECYEAVRSYYSALLKNKHLEAQG
jgi:hypothetical protein